MGFICFSKQFQICQNKLAFGAYPSPWPGVDVNLIHRNNIEPPLPRVKHIQLYFKGIMTVFKNSLSFRGVGPGIVVWGVKDFFFLLRNIGRSRLNYHIFNL